MNEWIQKLHCYISENVFAQICIDTYLPCYLLSGSIQNLASVQLCIEDTPQFGLLPDIGSAIRDCVIHNQKKNCILQHFLYICLPFHKNHSNVKNITDITSTAILLNILLASLLGLYPHNTKKTPFHQRANLYRSVHNLLTCNIQDQFHFISTHPQLFVFAVFEYLFHVIPAFCPVEYEWISMQCDMAQFFLNSSTLFDQFRQDNIYTGNESWQSLSSGAAIYNQKIHRMYKKKSKKAHLPLCVSTKKVDIHNLENIMNTPFIVQNFYNEHHQHTMTSEYTVLTNDSTAAQVATVHRCIHTEPLPQNLVYLQQQALQHINSRCHIKAHLTRTKHVCVICEPMGRPTKLRVCSQTGKPVCLKCTADSIISIDTIGKVVYIGKSQYMFMPCCGTTQKYTGTEGNIWTTLLPFGDNFNTIKCCHMKQVTDLQPYVHKRKCLICQDTALPEGYTRIEHRTAQMTTSFLCKRHTPPTDFMVHTYNFDQFEKACLAWAKKATLPKRQKIK